MTRNFLSRIVQALVAVAFMLFGSVQATAQSWPNPTLQDVYNQTPVTEQCSNPSFEAGMTDWTGFRAKHLSGLPYEAFIPAATPLLGNSCVPGAGVGNAGSGKTCHIVETSGVDPNMPSVSHPKTQAGGMSLRLGGTEFIPSQSNGNATEGMAKRFIVTAANAIYKFRYSSVMDKAHDATTAFTGQEPFFQAIAIDPTTGVVIDKITQPASGFNANMVLSPDKPKSGSATYGGQLVYSLWSCAQLDLSKYVGKEVVVYFINGDCVHGGHTAYTYIDDTCTKCDKPEDVGIIIDEKPAELKMCEPNGKVQVTGKFHVPQQLATSNVKILLEIRQGGTVVKTLTTSTISGNQYSFDVLQSDLKGIGCYDVVAILEYDVKTPSGNVVHVKRETSAEGMKPGKDNDICVVDCPPPVEKTGCFPTDPKVTCGKTPGTYVITLQAPNNGSTSPTEVELSVLTPGVTILNPQQVYQVNANGQIQLTVSGAAPGTAVEFDISGSRPDPKSADGMSICCTGKIKVEIPKDIECNIKPKLEVTKACLPAKPNPAGGYTAMCQIKVKSTGAFTNPISIVETLSGNGKVTYVSATDPWACAPASVTSPAPISCTLPGNTLNPVTDTSIINVKVDFKNAADAKEAKNCVQHVVTANRLSPKYCVPFTVEEKSTVDVDKKCGPAKLGKYPLGPAATGIGYISKCTITVTTTGPQTGTLSMGDTLTGGNLLNLSSTSTPAWSCGATTCSIAGANLNQTSSTSTFTSTVVFPNNPGAVKEGRNCATVARGQKRLAKDCEDFRTEDGTLTVVKQAFVNGTHYTAQTFAAKVICGGNVVVANIQDGGAPYVQAGLPIGTSCTVDEGNNITAPAGFCKAGETATWLPSYSPASPVTIAAGNTTVTVTNQLMCNPPPVDGTIKVVKTCDPVEEVVGAINSWQAKCKITVTTTGSQSGTIQVNDTITGISGVTVASMASSTTPPWSCAVPNCTINGTSLNQSASTSVIDVVVKFPTQGHASESKNCGRVSVNGTQKGESCTPFTVKPPTVKHMDVKKVVVNNSPGSVAGMVFVLRNTCTNDPTSAGLHSISDGQTQPSHLYMAGVSCTVTEDPIPATNACGPSAKPVWTTSYSPSQTVALVPTGNLVTVTNTLNCEKTDQVGQLLVKKVVVNNAPGSVAGLTYAITDSCSGSTQNPGYAIFSDGQTIPFKNYEAGISCTITERPDSFVWSDNNGSYNGNHEATQACGPGAKPVWSTTYSPSQTVALAPGGNLVTVTNTLNCEKVEPVVYPFTVYKQVVNNAPGSVAGLVFPITSTCTPNTTSAHSPMAVGYTAGQGTIFGGALGDTCTITEGTIPQTNACGGDKPVWTTTYQPSATLTIGATNAPITVTNTLNCEPIIISLPKCDTATATPAGDLCRCRFDNMVPVSKTECRCERGYQLVAGKGCEKVIVKPDCKASQIYNAATNRCITPPPNCDERTTKLSNGECRCTVRGMVPVSKTRCDCPSGTELRNGSCQKPPPVCKEGTRATASGKCVSICTGNTDYNFARNRCEPNCARGFRYDVGQNRCERLPPECKEGTRANSKGQCVSVCERGLRYNTGRNRCEPVCQRGTRYDAGENRCERVQPDCQRGARFNAKRNRCEPVCPRGLRYDVRDNRCEEVVRNCPEGTRRIGNICVPFAKCPRGQIAVGPICMEIDRPRKRDVPQEPDVIKEPREDIKIPGID